MPSSSSSYVSREGIYGAEIRKERSPVLSDLLRVLDEELPIAQLLGMLQDLLKFAPCDLAIEGGT
jgi:hypothetical protein